MRLTKRDRVELEAWAAYGKALHEGLTKAGAQIVQYICGCTYVVGVGLPMLSSNHSCSDRVAITLGPSVEKLKGLGAKVSLMSPAELDRLVREGKAVSAAAPPYKAD